MIINTYRLKKSLIGRTATQFNWGLSSIPHQVFLKVKDNRIINGKSLIGLLSGHFVEGDVIEIAAKTQEEQDRVKQLVLELDIAIPVNNLDVEVKE